MIALFPTNPLGASVDDAFADEMDAAEEAGLTVGLIDTDKMVVPDLALEASRLGEPAVYRGWMLNGEQYEQVYKMVWDRGFRLVNDPKEYLFCHELPRWYDEVGNVTPPSVWFEKGPDDSLWYEVLVNRGLVKKVRDELGPGPYIVKDYVKSQKHYWNEACFIEGPDHIDRVTRRFLELQGPDLAGGLVYRKFQQFRQIGSHPKSDAPINHEVRLFVARGHIIQVSPYWDFEDGGLNIKLPETEVRSELLSSVKSNFFTIDMGLLPESYGPYVGSERWVIIELGDGQVSQIPNIDPATRGIIDLKGFFYSLKEAFDVDE